MSRRLSGGPEVHYRTTDHAEEIAELWANSTKQDDKLRMVDFMLAAELLQAHDDTGISLDDWPTARQFVERHLGQDILPNLI